MRRMSLREMWILSKKELITLGSFTDEALLHGRFGARLDSGHCGIACPASQTRKLRTQPFIVDYSGPSAQRWDHLPLQGRWAKPRRTVGKRLQALAPQTQELAALVANKDFMNVQTIGASKRARLTLDFGGNSKPHGASADRRSPTLPGHELRRLVALMID
jgi:hypothetical protein